MPESQLTLFGSAVKVSHRAQPTSLAAAERVLPRTGTQRAKVLAMIRAAGEYGATDVEIQEATGIGADSERPRRLELVEGGWITDSGLRRTHHPHGEAIVWVAT